MKVIALLVFTIVASTIAIKQTMVIVDEIDGTFRIVGEKDNGHAINVQEDDEITGRNGAGIDYIWRKLFAWANRTQTYYAAVIPTASEASVMFGWNAVELIGRASARKGIWIKYAPLKEMRCKIIVMKNGSEKLPLTFLPDGNTTPKNQFETFTAKLMINTEENFPAKGNELSPDTWGKQLSIKLIGENKNSFDHTKKHIFMTPFQQATNEIQWWRLSISKAIHIQPGFIVYNLYIMQEIHLKLTYKDKEFGRTTLYALGNIFNRDDIIEIDSLQHFWNPVKKEEISLGRQHLEEILGSNPEIKVIFRSPEIQKELPDIPATEWSGLQDWRYELGENGVARISTTSPEK